MVLRILAKFPQLIDLIIPPRPTEHLVREVTLEALEETARRFDGVLPYHDKQVQALVWEIKYYANKRALALCGKLLSEQLLGVAAESLGKPILIPTPMHPRRQRERGHNQTELLAKAALAHTQGVFEYSADTVLRTKHTTQQQGLPMRVREKNVRGSMAVRHPERVQGRVCVVLDDVTTTGATFREIRKVLMDAGATEVVLVALAHS